jgi:Ca2+-binding EF-hand superfamily protein
MLAAETIRLIGELINQTSTHELKLEAIRQVLCEQSLFDPYSTFQRLDRTKNDCIQSVDILSFLKENGVQATEKECYYVLKHYDVDGDNKLSYIEFLKIILPAFDPKLHEEACTRPITKVDKVGVLHYDIEYSLTQLIEKEIVMYRTVEKVRGQLNSRFDFSICDAFSSIAEKGTVIDVYQLSKFAKQHKLGISDTSMAAFIKRYDNDRNGKLQFMEFADAITPNDPSTKTRPNFSKNTETSDKKKWINRKPQKKAGLL